MKHCLNFSQLSTSPFPWGRRKQNELQFILTCTQTLTHTLFHLNVHDLRLLVWKIKKRQFIWRKRWFSAVCQSVWSTFPHWTQISVSKLPTDFYQSHTIPNVSMYNLMPTHNSYLTKISKQSMMSTHVKFFLLCFAFFKSNLKMQCVRFGGIQWWGCRPFKQHFARIHFHSAIEIFFFYWWICFCQLEIYIWFLTFPTWSTFSDSERIFYLFTVLKKTAMALKMLLVGLQISRHHD